MSKQYFATSLIPNAHKSDIFSVATSKSYALTCSGSSEISIWNAAPSSDHALVRTIPTSHRIGIHHVCVDESADLLAACGFEGDISLYSLSTGTRKTTLSNPKSSYWAIAFSDPAEFLVATALNGTITVFNTADDAIPQCGYLQTKGSPGLAIDYSSDGKFIASAHENGGLYIFSTETARLLHSLPGHIKPIRTLAFSPSSKLIAAAGDSCVITVYDVASAEQVFNLPGHTRWVMALDWNVTGEYLLSGSFDKSLRVWSVESTECVASQTESDGPIWAVKWIQTRSPQGFLSAGTDKTIRWYREATGG
ncbi:WD40-repeat-containing domain protein [Lipomyces arxii]|uniref:WD40-repeat-containing domain protein n=1 Tax=Lipomyces arxii TaxID=56418 RepID=UPI0034CDA7E5